MKRVLAAALLVISTSTMADPIVMATSNNGKIEWIGYTESFEMLSDGVSLIIGEREYINKKTGAHKPETRKYYGISYEDCARGYGSLMAKNSTNSPWYLVFNVSLKKPNTVGDQVAAIMCDAGKKSFRKNNVKY